MVSCGPHVAPCWAKLNPSWVRVGLKFVQVGPSWSELALSWPQDGKVRPCCFMLAPNWPHAGPSPKVSPRLAKASSKARPLRPWFSKISTKALPQGFQRLLCWFGLFRPFCLDLKGCFFLVLLFVPALSWQLVQNGVSKSSSQLVFVASSFWKFHPFSCIARRHSSADIHTYIPPTSYLGRNMDSH